MKKFSALQGLQDKNLKLIQDRVQTLSDQIQTYEANPANWVTPLPTDIYAALDRMAALLKTLNSGAKIP